MGSVPLVLAHDAARLEAVAALVRQFGAHIVQSRNLHVDMQLLIRATRFVGNPASTLSQKVNLVRHALGATSNLVVRTNNASRVAERSAAAPSLRSVA